MSSRERIFCDCGGELRRPLPPKCPHCGGQIIAVRRRWWTLVPPVILVAAIFLALAWFAWWAAAPR